MFEIIEIVENFEKIKTNISIFSKICLIREKFEILEKIKTLASSRLRQPGFFNIFEIIEIFEIFENFEKIKTNISKKLNFFKNLLNKGKNLKF